MFYILAGFPSTFGLVFSSSEALLIARIRLKIERTLLPETEDSENFSFGKQVVPSWHSQPYVSQIETLNDFLPQSFHLN